jgi:hypothetical protein
MSPTLEEFTVMIILAIATLSTNGILRKPCVALLSLNSNTPRAALGLGLAGQRGQSRSTPPRE